MAKKTMKPQLGSIISGTLREEDLIPAFADELRRISDDPEHLKLCDEADEIEFDDAEFADEHEFLLSDLQDALAELAPDYTYFGAHPSDGADFGFWLYEDVGRMVRDDGGIVVSDLSEVPEDFEGTVLNINDHGNATLYSIVDGRRKSIWSVV